MQLGVQTVVFFTHLFRALQTSSSAQQAPLQGLAQVRVPTSADPMIADCEQAATRTSESSGR